MITAICVGLICFNANVNICKGDFRGRNEVVIEMTQEDYDYYKDGCKMLELENQKRLEKSANW